MRPEIERPSNVFLSQDSRILDQPMTQLREAECATAKANPKTDNTGNTCT
jgi:hypothetical protein